MSHPWRCPATKSSSTGTSASTRTPATGGCVRRWWGFSRGQPICFDETPAFPTVFRGQGVRVTDAGGREYFDCLSAAGTLVLGHNHLEVSAAVRQAIDDGIAWQTLDIATPAKDAFTEALFATLPDALARRARIQVRSPSGSERSAWHRSHPISDPLRFSATRLRLGRAIIRSIATGQSSNPLSPPPLVWFSPKRFICRRRCSWCLKTWLCGR